MRHTVSIVLVSLASAWGVAWWPTPRSWVLAGPPPLSLDGYRDEKLPTGRDDSLGLQEINGGCYVCHGNYRNEALVQSHAKKKVGCVECHGNSIPHQVDEFHRTPPEKMYAPHNIDTMCRQCHVDHQASARKVIERWQQRCPAKTDPKAIVCTDCHFEHRLSSRTVVWDKKTGKLILRQRTENSNRGRGQ
jgi:hypothetical protein